MRSELTVDARIQKLERGVRRARIVTWGLLACCFAALSTLAITYLRTPTPAPLEDPATPVVGPLRASAFILEDALGRTRGEFSLAGAGPQLLLYDNRGRSRLQVVSSDSGPAVSFLDSGGTPRLALTLLSGTPMLAAFDDAGAASFSLGTESGGGGPSLVLCGERGKPAATLAALPDGGTVFSMVARPDAEAIVSVGRIEEGTYASLSMLNGEPTVRLASQAGVGSLKVGENGASMTFADTDGSLRAIIGAAEGGSHLTLFDFNGRPRAVLGSTSAALPVSTLRLFEANGRVLWSAPAP